MPVLRKVSASAQAAETASVTETKTPFFGVNSEEKFFGTMDAMVKAGKVGRVLATTPLRLYLLQSLVRMP